MLCIQYNITVVAQTQVYLMQGPRLLVAGEMTVVTNSTADNVTRAVLQYVRTCSHINCALNVLLTALTLHIVKKYTDFLESLIICTIHVDLSKKVFWFKLSIEKCQTAQYTVTIRTVEISICVSWNESNMSCSPHSKRDCNICHCRLINPCTVYKYDQIHRHFV